MNIDRRAFLAASAASAIVAPPLRAAASPVFRPEDYGARGDGATNDTQAFARLCAAVQRQGGGTISLRAGRTYIVGAQAPGGGPAALNPLPIIHLDRLAAPLLILGNGARLRAQPGLKFGTFDPRSGKRVDHAMPNLDRSDLAIPYRGMVWLSHCSGPVEIRDLELDGNVDRLNIGGKFGDKGWQVPANGLLLQLNTGSETVTNIFTHHHALDGAQIVGEGSRSQRSRISLLVSRYNGRQGLSITGGRGYDIVDCEFSHTGRGVVHSAPGAGVDIEAEHQRRIRDLSFTRCKFIDNLGCGLVADSGDSEGVRFTDCSFVGTTSWSAWPNKPRFSFAGCTFVGAVVHAFADADPARAAHFTACRFTDDPKLSPTGKVFSGKAAGGPIANLAQSDNVSFDRCTFDLVGSAKLPRTNRAIYRDCTMRQRSPDPSAPGGRYLGRTTITGRANLSGSSVEGSVVLNGRELRGKVG